MPVSARTCTWVMVSPLAGRSHRKSTKAMVLRSLSYYRSVYMMSPHTPVYFQECLLMAIHWTPTTELTACQVQPSPPQAMASLLQTECVGKHNVLLKCCLFSLSSGVSKRTSSHMCSSWYCSCLLMNHSLL